jgi:hypothetical protein
MENKPEIINDNVSSVPNVHKSKKHTKKELHRPKRKMRQKCIKNKCLI